MSKRTNYNLIGFSLSTLLYLVVILSLAFYLQEKIRKNIDYTVNKKSVLDVTLVKRKPKKIIKNSKKQRKKTIKKTTKKKKIITKPKPKKSAQKPQKKISLKGMFETIDINKTIELKQERVKVSRKKESTKDKNILKSSKKELAKKAVESLSFEKPKNMKSSKNGIYDKYRGEVQQILYENWQDTIDTVSGNRATVEIFVDKEGTFSYKIVKLSYNDEFNSKLVDFLEEMRDKKFPPFTEGEIFKQQVEFKDIRDD